MVLAGSGRQRAGWVVAGLVAVAMLAVSCSAPAGPAAGSRVPPGLADCAGAPHADPAVVVLSCSDSGITAHGLRWSGWGKPVATATGTAVVNTCEYEECAYGLYQAYPVVLIASRVGACPGGTAGQPAGTAYTRLQYVYVGRSPFPQSVTSSDKILTRPCR